MKKGFTLIELMVVVAVIGVLMAAGIVAFTQAQKKSRDAKRRADVEAFARAFEQYHSDRDSYPRFGGWGSSPSWGSSVINVFGQYFPEGSPPTDPINSTVGSKNYRYHIYSTGPNNPAPLVESYCVSALLEVSDGNCSGHKGINVEVGCTFVTPGTGSYYCAQHRQ